MCSSLNGNGVTLLHLWGHKKTGLAKGLRLSIALRRRAGFDINDMGTVRDDVSRLVTVSCIAF